jgi:hypothetical protein
MTRELHPVLDHQNTHVTCNNYKSTLYRTPSDNFRILILPLVLFNTIMSLQNCGQLWSRDTQPQQKIIHNYCGQLWSRDTQPQQRIIHNYCGQLWSRDTQPQQRIIHNYSNKEISFLPRIRYQENRVRNPVSLCAVRSV